MKVNKTKTESRNVDNLTKGTCILMESDLVYFRLVLLTEVI